ncbi:MAG: four helix bundle protein [Bacteroidales bacterium]|nr:four helix bundle protein [Bacteroidales bacterium]
MAIQKFEDIKGWQKAQDFAVQIYSEFKDLRDFGFRDQISRAVVSISNNIAEGFDRRTDADFARFVYIAIGSCSEVKSMLYLAYRLNFVERDKATCLIEQANEISKILRGLIKSLHVNYSKNTNN